MQQTTVNLKMLVMKNKSVKNRLSGSFCFVITLVYDSLFS